MEKNLKNPHKVLLRLINLYLHYEKQNEQISSDIFDLILKESTRHNLLQLIADVCSCLDEEQKKLMLSSNVQILMHYENQDYFRNRVFSVFESAGIDYMPLKGSVLKDYYNEPWHRTCGDIDILVRPEEIERAIEVLQKKQVCELKDKSEHDFVFIDMNGSILELHYDLHEEECDVNEVWRMAVKKDESSHLYHMTNEMFVFCHIAHMAKHFRRSGCGLRPFVDLYIIKNRLKYDESILYEMLKSAMLEKFYTSMMSFVGSWFEEKELSPELNAVSEYILNGGVFGSVENKVAIKRFQMSGLKYFFKRAFVSRESLAYKYPILNKYPYLYLFCNFHRWYRLIFKGKFYVVKDELLTNASLDNDISKRIEKMYSEIGL